jgi:threonine/homoserine/homoserine lactone efflux protein
MDVDDRITAALLHDAPPPRDPLFRIRVLERAERQRFRRSARLAIAGAVGVLLVSVLTVSAGSMAYVAGSVLLFALVVVTGAVYLPELGRLISRLSI